VAVGATVREGAGAESTPSLTIGLPPQAAKLPGSAGIRACLPRSVGYIRKPRRQGWAALPGGPRA